MLHGPAGVIKFCHVREPDNNCSFYSYVNEEEGMPKSYQHGETEKTRRPSTEYTTHDAVKLVRTY